MILYLDTRHRENEMSSSKESKAKSYYDKALQYYKTERSFGDDGYEVYAQCLFDLLYGKDIKSEEKQLKNSVFHNLLSDWMKNKKEFSLSSFRNDMQKRYDKRKKRDVYNFVFGVHIKSSRDNFPYKKRFKLLDTFFEIITYKKASSLTDGNYITELTDLYRQKRYQKLWIDQALRNDYVFFKASTRSIDSIVAANKVTTAFELLTASATIAQERHSRTYHTSGTIKSKQPILQPHSIYWLDTNNAFEASLAILGADIQVPDARLSFTEDKIKLKNFRRYLSIVNKPKLTPIERRIQDVIFEFDRALGLTDPSSRMFSLWRCLEIASRLENGSTRKYSDIIEIIKNYHDNEIVNEKARLVLEARNEYVHQGLTIDYEKRDNYLRWVHDFASAYLGLLMWMRSKKIGSKSSSEIDKLFDFYRQSDQDLTLAGKLLYARRKDKKRFEAMKRKTTNK